MGSGGDKHDCIRLAGELLPSGAEHADAASSGAREIAAHVAVCAECARLLESRARVADVIRRLPRRRAPADAGGVLDFAAVFAQLDLVAADLQLARDEARFGPLLRRLPRFLAPRSLTVPGLAPVRPLTATRWIAAMAATLVVGASLYFAPFLELRRDASGSRLAASTAALSERPRLAVRVVYVSPDHARAPLPGPLVPRGGP